MLLSKEDQEEYNKEWLEIRANLDAETDPKKRKKYRQQLSYLADRYRGKQIQEVVFEDYAGTREMLEQQVLDSAQKLIDFMGCSAFSLPLGDQVLEVRDKDDGK